MSVGTLPQFKTRVENQLGRLDSDKLRPTTEAWDEILADALDLYNHHRPLERIHQQAGDGTTRRIVLSTTLDGWSPGTSRVTAVLSVLNADTATEEETAYPIEAWSQRRDVAGHDVLFLSMPVSTGRTLRIRWTAPHLIHPTEANQTTVPAGDTHSLILMAVAKACEWIARSASDLANRDMGAEQVDYLEISERWARRAKEAMKAAMERIAPEAPRFRAAGTSVEWEGLSQLGRQPWIGH